MSRETIPPPFDRERAWRDLTPPTPHGMRRRHGRESVAGKRLRRLRTTAIIGLIGAVTYLLYAGADWIKARTSAATTTAEAAQATASGTATEMRLRLSYQTRELEQQREIARVSAETAHELHATLIAVARKCLSPAEFRRLRERLTQTPTTAPPGIPLVPEAASSPPTDQ